MRCLLRFTGTLFPVMVVLLVVTARAQAQNGCVNSPESPTAVLMVVGSLGGLVTAARARLLRKR